MGSCDVGVEKSVLEMPATEEYREGDVFDINRLTAKFCVEKEW